MYNAPAISYLATMADHCCAPPSLKLDPEQGNAYRRVLWAVLAVNGTMFLAEIGAGLASGVQDDPVTLLKQQLRCHPAEAVGRSGDEYACHSFAPSYLEMICCECQCFSDRSFKVVSQS